MVFARNYHVVPTYIHHSEEICNTISINYVFSTHIFQSPIEEFQKISTELLFSIPREYSNSPDSSQDSQCHAGIYTVRVTITKKWKIRNTKMKINKITLN